MRSIHNMDLRLGGSLATLAFCALAIPTAHSQTDQPAVADIVVTGSLIARPNNVAVSPIVTVSDELVQQSGQITLEDSLNQLPGFTPSGNAGTGGQGAGGRATLNLRVLGSNRNLVLLDGHRDPLSGSQRGFFAGKVPSSFIGTGAFVPDALNLPSQTALNGVFARYGVTTPVNRTLNLGFNDNGSLFVQTGAINYQGPRTGAYAVVGGNVRMPVGPQLQILNEFERKSAFAKGEYDLTDTLTAYGQFLYVDSTVTTESGSSLTQFAPFTTIPVTNPFIPADLRTLLASRTNPNAPFRWSPRYVGIGDKGWEENYRVQQYLGGLKGALVGSWKFDGFVSYDETVHDQSMFNAVLKSRVQTLLNAADGAHRSARAASTPSPSSTPPTFRRPVRTI